MKQTKNTAASVVSLLAVVCLSFVFGFVMTAMFTEEVAAAAFNETAVQWKNDANDTDVAISDKIFAYTTPMSSFSDVSTSDWYYTSAAYCVQNRLVAGYEDGRFYPDAKISRGMFAVVLWGMEGYPSTNFTVSASDVTDNLWCHTAVCWAVEANIIDGYGDGTLRPDELISREQLATMAWRYLKHTGVVPEDNRTALDPYEDADLISEYANEAMRWAANTGALIGENGIEIVPKGKVTRAHLVTFLQRYITANSLSLPPNFAVGHILVDLIVTAPPDRTIYSGGDSFDPTGMIITAVYLDGTRKRVDGYSATLSPDGQLVTIGFEGVETTIDLTSISADGWSERPNSSSRGGSSGSSRPSVPANPLTGIRVTTPPSKTTYICGESFDRNGMVVTAFYSDGTTRTLEDYTVTPIAMLDDVTSVTISYGGFGDTVAVTVERIALDRVPTHQSNALTYNGSEQWPEFEGFEADKMMLTGSTSAYNAGTYYVTCVPKIGYKWPDGTIDAIPLSWSIAKAAHTDLMLTEGAVTKHAYHAAATQEDLQGVTVAADTVVPDTDPAVTVWTAKTDATPLTLTLYKDGTGDEAAYVDEATFLVHVDTDGAADADSDGVPDNLSITVSDETKACIESVEAAGENTYRVTVRTPYELDSETGERVAVLDGEDNVLSYKRVHKRADGLKIVVSIAESENYLAYGETEATEDFNYVQLNARFDYTWNVYSLKWGVQRLNTGDQHGYLVVGTQYSRSAYPNSNGTINIYNSYAIPLIPGGIGALGYMGSDGCWHTNDVSNIVNEDGTFKVSSYLSGKTWGQVEAELDSNRLICNYYGVYKNKVINYQPKPHEFDTDDDNNCYLRVYIDYNASYETYCMGKGEALAGAGAIVSSPDPNAYPLNGRQGNYWYVFVN